MGAYEFSGAPGLSLSPTSLSFPDQLVGTSSTAQSFTLTNLGTPALSLCSITTSGDFSQTNNCGTSLAAGASCDISVSFLPTVQGTRSGEVTISSSAVGSPHGVSLSSTGINPLPALSSLSPSQTTVGGPGFTLTVDGSNFVSNSVVRWSGRDQPTMLVSGTQLIAAIPAAVIATAGEAQVTVSNPAPGGGVSNALTFLTSNPTVNPGGTVNGASFDPGAAVAPGALISLFGASLASTTEVAQSIPLPTQGPDRPFLYQVERERIHLRRK